jgi:hypothetical protein
LKILSPATPSFKASKRVSGSSPMFASSPTNCASFS